MSIQINQENTLTVISEARSNIDRTCRFCDSALLIDKRNNFHGKFSFIIDVSDSFVLIAYF